MAGEERRAKIKERLGKTPVTASALAKELGVSRQVIVQDVALLRAEGTDILSTHRGYVAGRKGARVRIFKVRHSDEDTESELFAVADEGGCVENVFVHHKVYGTLTAYMGIDSRLKARKFMEKIKSGKSALLKNVTSGYHYHTVSAESEEVLDAIEGKLRALGFLVERAESAAEK